MTASMKHRPATGLTYRQAQHLRRRLVSNGVEPWLVSATADADLVPLLNRTRAQLTLVPDVEDTPPAPVHHPTWTPFEVLDETLEAPDEAASTAFFLRSLAADRCGVDRPDADSYWFDGRGPGGAA